MMKTTVVRYQAKADRADENQRLIEAVFAQLDEQEPQGFTYKVFRLEDGVSFVHVAIEHDDVDNPDSLQDVLDGDRKSTRLNSSHRCISYAVFCLKKKKDKT